jgi:U5 small nuclear ribonucleoprotein component
MCVQHIPSPVDNARLKVQHIYTGPLETALGEDMCNCDPDVSTHMLLCGECM